MLSKLSEKIMYLLLPKISIYLFGKVTITEIVINIIIRISGIDIYNSTGTRRKS